MNCIKRSFAWFNFPNMISLFALFVFVFVLPAIMNNVDEIECNFAGKKLKEKKTTNKNGILNPSVKLAHCSRIPNRKITSEELTTKPEMSKKFSKENNLDLSFIILVYGNNTKERGKKGWKISRFFVEQYN